jgi:L-asparaginase
VTVAIVFTGGTIASRVDDSAGGVVPRLHGADIIARTPDLARVAEVEAIDWGLMPASHMGFGQILEIARLIESTLRRTDIDGVVVVQGTDTLEETSFGFDLLVGSEKPVVVTGAMRNASQADYDGPRNLLDAVACAASPALRGQGTVVMLDGRIIGADLAVKTHATAIDTFQARDGDPMGEVREGFVRIDRSRVPRRLPAIPASAAEPVYLVTVTTGMDGALIRGVAATQPAGLVVAATGSGNTPPDVLVAAQEVMSAGSVIVLTTRCAGGSVEPIYAFPGGGAAWERAGALLSRLSGPKARIALGLGLGAGLAGDELRAVLRA